MLVQFKVPSKFASDLKLIISFVLLSFAYSISYVIAVVIFIKDLIGQSTRLFFHLSRTLILLVSTSFVLTSLCKLRPSFANLSALSFQRSPLCLLILMSSISMFFALQHSFICLIKLWFLVLKSSRMLFEGLLFIIPSIAALLSEKIFTWASQGAAKIAVQIALSSARVDEGQSAILLLKLISSNLFSP